jgi:glycosyltransferase involved in cell wall biosynthesis
VRVAINAQLLTFANSVRNGGISRYSYGLLNALGRAPGGHDYDVYVSRDGRLCRSILDEKLNVHETGAFTVNPGGRIVWEQAVYPFVLRRRRADVVHNLAFASPVLDNHRTVLTVHDLSFLHYGHLFNTPNRLYLGLVCKLSAARATRIITVSKAMRADIARTLGVAEGRIDVTYPGVDNHFRPLPADVLGDFRRAHDLPETFILHIATLEPRKNLSGLLRAYALLARPRPALYVIGALGWRSKSTLDQLRVLQLEDDVHFMGFRPADELPAWYGAATAFAFPSLYEGFGLPVIEAMACGTPVLTSDRGSLREIASGAAELVNPTDAQSLAQTMQALLDDTARRDTLREAGFRRSEHFRWAATANATVKSYELAAA